MRWLQLVHSVPGRTRLRFPALRHEPATQERVADELVAVTGVREVRIRPFTGSILVTHDRGLTGAAVLDAAHRITGADFVLAAGQSPPVSGEAPTLSRIAQLTARAFRDIDHDVLLRSGGSLDLGTLVTLGFLAAGAIGIGVDRQIQMPPWFNLAWWGYRTFMVNEQEEINAEGD
jgi:hypothetical protein